MADVRKVSDPTTHRTINGNARLTPAEAARQHREAFLNRGWPTSIEVGVALGGDDPAQYAADLRAAGRLLGAWSAPKRTYVHPDCQFIDIASARDGSRRTLLPAMYELLQILPSAGDDGGWRRVFWLYSPRRELSGLSPAEVMQGSPHRVVELARREFATRSSRLLGS